MKKLPIILIVVIGVVVLSFVALIPQKNIEQPKTMMVFDLNFCPNQNNIVGEMWFVLEEFVTIPVRATINYEINNLDKLVEEGRINITPDDFRTWTLGGTESHVYDFEIPVQSNVTDNYLIITVTLDGGGNLVYEDIIPNNPSLDNCKWR